jgi:hypothetical protein
MNAKIEKSLSMAALFKKIRAVAILLQATRNPRRPVLPMAFAAGDRSL